MSGINRSTARGKGFAGNSQLDELNQKSEGSQGKGLVLSEANYEPPRLTKLVQANPKSCECGNPLPPRLRVL